MVIYHILSVFFLIFVCFCFHRHLCGMVRIVLAKDNWVLLVQPSKEEWEVRKDDKNYVKNTFRFKAIQGSQWYICVLWMSLSVKGDGRKVFSNLPPTSDIVWFHITFTLLIHILFCICSLKREYWILY